MDLTVLAWIKDRWVAFGDTLDGPATWSSQDGVAWHRGVIHSSGPRSTPVHVAAVASSGDLAVAVGFWREQTSGGSLDDPIADSGSTPSTVSSAMERPGRLPFVPTATCEGVASADATALTSTDGVTWTQIADSHALHGQPMLGVAMLNGSFVAAGGADGSGRSAAWTSPDGRHWTRAPDSPALRAGWIGSLATLGDSLVAVGAEACSNEQGAPRAWRSLDGRSWALATGVLDQTCCGAVQAVAVSDGIAVADGSATPTTTADTVSTTWTSVDGSTWARHPHADQTDPGWIGPIVGVDGGFFGAGEGVWSSSDGVTWTNVVSRDVSFQAVAVGPNGTLAVGFPDVWAGPATISSP